MGVAWNMGVGLSAALVSVAEYVFRTPSPRVPGSGFEDFDEISLRVADEEDARPAFGRSWLAQRRDARIEFRVEAVEVVDGEAEMFHTGLIQFGAGRRGTFGVVLDELDPGAVGVEVGEPARRSIHVDGVGEGFAGDGEAFAGAETQSIPVELDCGVEVGHGHAEVVGSESGHVMPAAGRRQSRFDPTGIVAPRDSYSLGVQGDV